MKKIIALIAMLSVAFLASCTKEEVTTDDTAVVETPVVEVETEMEMEDTTVEADAGHGSRSCWNDWRSYGWNYCWSWCWSRS